MDGGRGHRSGRRRLRRRGGGAPSRPDVTVSRSTPGSTASCASSPPGSRTTRATSGAQDRLRFARDVIAAVRAEIGSDRARRLAPVLRRARAVGRHHTRHGARHRCRPVRRWARLPRRRARRDLLRREDATGLPRADGFQHRRVPRVVTAAVDVPVFLQGSVVDRGTGGMGDRRRRVRRRRDDAGAARRSRTSWPSWSPATRRASARASAATRRARCATRATRSSPASASRSRATRREDPRLDAPAARHATCSSSVAVPPGSRRPASRRDAGTVCGSSSAANASAGWRQSRARAAARRLARRPSATAPASTSQTDVADAAPSQRRGGRAVHGHPLPVGATYEIIGDAIVLDIADVRAGTAHLPDDGRSSCVFDPIGGPIAVALAEDLGARAVLVTQDQIAGNELSRTGDLAPANSRLQQRGVRIERRSLLREVHAGPRRGRGSLQRRTSTHRRRSRRRLRVPPAHASRSRTHTSRAGDCVAPRTILEAVLEARRAAPRSDPPPTWQSDTSTTRDFAG